MTTLNIGAGQQQRADQVVGTSMSTSSSPPPVIGMPPKMQSETSLSTLVTGNMPESRSPKDFIFIRTIGEGSFSTVYLSKEVSSGRQYAIKVCNKAQIRKENKVHLILREKEVMARLSRDDSHPCFVRLYCTFQDTDRLYFAMTYAKNGELLDCLRKLGSFDDEATQFYSAEIVSALDYLHSLGIIHRDLKPENILIGENRHILISDFGSSKIIGRDDVVSDTSQSKNVRQSRTKRSSFVGTAQYVSPEILNGKPVGPACDYWALGCLIYQFLSALPPFRAVNEYLVFQKILKIDYSFPPGFPPIARDLVEKLIVLDQCQRYGSEEMGGVHAVKSHPFFSGINWSTLHNREPPALKPYLPASGDEPAFHSDYHVPEDLEPGLDDAAMTRLMGLQLADFSHAQLVVENASAEERRRRLDDQRRTHKFHRFVDDNLILKSGPVDKKKGLFARRRMFLLTEGPHLYYVDPTNMELKGEIPWCRQLRTEAKNFRTFFVHTPNRTYYLFDPARQAVQWCEAIEAVRERYYCQRGGDDDSGASSRR